jgi:hypothetical protein
VLGIDGKKLAATAGLPPAQPPRDDDLTPGGGLGAALTRWRAVEGLSLP